MAAVIFLHGFECGQGGGRAGDGLVEKRFDFGVDDGMVAFQREHVIGVRFANLFGDGFLTAHRVHRDDAAGQFEQPQEGRDGGDLVAFLGHFELAEHQAVVRGPGGRTDWPDAAPHDRRGVHDRGSIARTT